MKQPSHSGKCQIEEWKWENAMTCIHTYNATQISLAISEEFLLPTPEEECGFPCSFFLLELRKKEREKRNWEGNFVLIITLSTKENKDSLCVENERKQSCEENCKTNHSHKTDRKQWAWLIHSFCFCLTYYNMASTFRIAAATLFSHFPFPINN